MFQVLRIKAMVLLACLATLLLTSAHSQKSSILDSFGNGTTSAFSLNPYTQVESLFGKVVKAIVQGGLSFASLASPLLCPILVKETDSDDSDQPTLYIFNSPEHLEHSVRIYTEDDITSEFVEYAHFNRSQMTVILVHGWLGGIQNENFLLEAKNVALGACGNGSYPSLSSSYSPNRSNGFRPNVIIVDWTRFASGSLYTATNNVHRVSLRLARLILRLKKVAGLRPELMHCLGHSLGAHVCGQAARKAFAGNTKPATSSSSLPSSSSSSSSSLPSTTDAQDGDGGSRQQRLGRMGRITALDPGGFCFELGLKDETTYTGLRPSDALLVDTFNTNRYPFGNKLNVGQYNVRVNNGFKQPTCLMWHNSARWAEYFRSAIGLLLGNSVDAQTIACDHYFSTRFAYQRLSPTCSYVGYACDSYKNYLRGKCGQCNDQSQCYSMDFEYQKQNPSVENSVEQIATYSSYFNDFTGDGSQSELLGSVPYDARRIYYIRTTDDPPYCGMIFRVRVHLNRAALDMCSFRTKQLRLYFIDAQRKALNVMAGTSDSMASTVELYGPWPSEGEISYGLDGYTLTTLFILDPAMTSLGANQLKGLPVKDVVVIYNMPKGAWNPDFAPVSPVTRIDLDYLSASDQRIRSRYSTSLREGEFKVIYKYRGYAIMGAISELVRLAQLE